jgi:hypothetical protein
MTNANSTETLATPALNDFRQIGVLPTEHEKMSRSMVSLTEGDLLDLRGKRIQLIQASEYGFPEERVIARVMAVAVPAAGTNIKTSLLLLPDGCEPDYMHYHDVTTLTLQAVFQ